MKALLVVEDDKLLGKEITEELIDAGYEVFWARDGREAFEALNAQEVGFVYLDLMLPGEMDGFEILRRMKLEDKYKNIPVVILSNLGQMNEIDRAMGLGASDYVIKANIDLDKLVELTRAKMSP
jgi:DNA-binding response OmpR family regulator